VIPTLDDILERTEKAIVLSKLDLANGFYQIALEDQSKNLTIFACPEGRFSLNRMPFGLKNASAVFLALMVIVLV